MFKLRGAGQGIVYFLITCWTWVIPWAIIIFIGRWAYRRWVTPYLKADRARMATATAVAAAAKHQSMSSPAASSRTARKR